MKTTLVVQVQDKTIPADSVGVKELNFGQRTRGVPVLPYRLHMPVSVWVPVLRPLYEELVSDLKGDEPFDDGQNEPTNHLREAGWPDLDTLRSQHPSVVVEVLQVFLIGDLLDRLMWSPKGSAPLLYVINSVDEIHTPDGDLLLTGDVFVPHHLREPPHA